MNEKITMIEYDADNNKISMCKKRPNQEQAYWENFELDEIKDLINELNAKEEAIRTYCQKTRETTPGEAEDQYHEGYRIGTNETLDDILYLLTG